MKSKKKKRKKPGRQVTDPVAKELDAVKRLLVLQLLASGVSQGDIVVALGIDQAAVSRLVPTKGLKCNKKPKPKKKKTKKKKKTGTTKKVKKKRK